MTLRLLSCTGTPCCIKRLSWNATTDQAYPRLSNAWCKGVIDCWAPSTHARWGRPLLPVRHGLCLMGKEGHFNLSSKADIEWRFLGPAMPDCFSETNEMALSLTGIILVRNVYSTILSLLEIVFTYSYWYPHVVWSLPGASW